MSSDPNNTEPNISDQNNTEPNISDPNSSERGINLNNQDENRIALNRLMKYPICRMQIDYKKKITMHNDPTISRRMRYSQIVNTQSSYKQISYEKYVELYGIPTHPPNPPNPNNRLFMTLFF